MSIYLKAKHWQLFVVFMGSAFLSQVIIASTFPDGEGVNLVEMMIPTLVWAIVFFGWIWAIAAACSKALPPELSSSPRPMQGGLIYALAYMMFGAPSIFSSDGGVPGYLMAMHLLAMAAIFYALGFTAKQLTKLERKHDVSFFEYSGPFFLLWFFLIGVWFVQPKVNQLLGGRNA